MGISGQSPPPQKPTRRASWASVARALSHRSQPGEHHESWASVARALRRKSQPGEHHGHQWPQPSATEANPASIMSISGQSPQPQKPTRRASWASVAAALSHRSQPGEHHEHQWPEPSAAKVNPASIMGISGRSPQPQKPTRRAS